MCTKSSTSKHAHSGRFGTLHLVLETQTKNSAPTCSAIYNYSSVCTYSKLHVYFIFLLQPSCSVNVSPFKDFLLSHLHTAGTASALILACFSFRFLVLYVSWTCTHLMYNNSLMKHSTVLTTEDTRTHILCSVAHSHTNIKSLVQRKLEKHLTRRPSSPVPKKITKLSLCQ